MTAEGKSKGWKGPSRRTVPRFVVQAPLDVTVLRSGIPDTVPGRSVNLGERGIAAMMAGELMPGETVGVEVRLPQIADPFRTRAMVRYQDKLRCGLEFVGLSAEQRASIRDWAKDAKALDPEVHLNAVAGIAQVVESALESRQKIAGDKSESASEKSRDKITAKPTVKWGTKAPETDTAEIKINPAVTGGGGPSSRLVSVKPKKRRGVAWIIFLVAVAMALAIFWWRWNRGWQELESGLKTAQTAAAEKPQAQVPAEVMEKLLVHRVEPTYPPEARQARLEGIIALDIVVGRDGSVISTRPLNGPEVLARAATDALRWWKFEPYRLNGEPAVVETTVAVEFKR